MIKLSDGELLNLLPSQMKNDTDMQCLSYALKVAVGEILEYERGTMTQSFIDSLPEKILDVLAVELRAPYYEDDMEISVKRGIIANALRWHTMAGTPGAVSELVQVVFGEGKVIEWWNFEDGDKTPGTFDIETNARQTQDELEKIAAIIDRVKNARSHLRAIKTHREIINSAHIASAYVSTMHESVTNQSEKKTGTRASPAYAMGVAAVQNDIVANTSRQKGETANGRTVSCCMISLPRTTIPRA